VVEIPEGRFLSGTLHLRSHVELHLEKGAVLLGSTKRHDYEKQLWYALIEAKGLEDVAITGEGTIDGQGAELAKDVLHMVDTAEIKIPPKGWRPSETERPQILEVIDCTNVRIKGVSILHSCCWVQTYRNCQNLKILSIHVDSKTYWNNDGIDLVDCRDAVVMYCDVDAADDGICLKSDDPKLQCDNIVVRECRVRSSASAIKFGTSSHGGFHKIRIDDIKIHDTFRSAVALESVDGGTMDDVIVSNIKAVHTGNAFFIRLGHRNKTGPTGRLRHIVLKNFDVQIPAGRPDMGYPFKGPQFTEPHNIEPASIVGLVQAPVEDVRLENIRIAYPGGGTVAFANVPRGWVPVRAEFYPEFTMFGELPAWALYARYVKGLTIKNFQVSRDAPDYRPPFVANEVARLSGNLQVVPVQGGH